MASSGSFYLSDHNSDITLSFVKNTLGQTLVRTGRAGTLANHARYLTREAVKSGGLIDPRTLLCVDCGVRATIYDHRDYTRPLDVVPVCTRCNILRGPGYPHRTAKHDEIADRRKKRARPKWTLWPRSVHDA